MFKIEKLKVLELFCGAGSFSVNLKSLNINHEIVGFSDIRESAIKLFCKIHGKKEYQNLGDIKNINANDLDVDLLVFGSPCFVAGTKVITNKGYKNIEDIKVGDMVLTHENRYRKVLKTGGDIKETVFVHSQGIKPTETTMNHPYYIRQKIKGNISDVKWEEVGNLKKGDYLALPIIEIEKNEYNLTKEECWLLGRYVADGHYRDDKRNGRINSDYYQVIYSIGTKKLEQFKEKVTDQHYSCYPHTKSVHRCVVSSKRMVELIKTEGFGKGAMNKRIPQFILELPQELATSFLEGYMDGDGCYDGNEFKANSISEELTMGLNLLIAKCYKVNSGYGYFERPKTCVIEGRTVNQNDTFTVSFRKEMKAQSRAKVIDDKIWLPFKKLEETNEMKQVYNLEVEEDNSYTANNAVVHNCQSFSRTGKSEGGKKGSNTKSSLMWESVRIMNECKPKWIVWENVPDAISKKHLGNFKEYMSELDEMGYNTYYEILYAYDLGSAQKRRRLFAVSIRKDIDNGEFKFLKNKEKNKNLIDYLENDVSDLFLVEEKILNELILEKNEVGFKIKNATKQGWLLAENGDTFDTAFPKSETRRGRVQKNACATLLRSKGIAVIHNDKIRYLTPKEYWRLQEMPEEMYDLVEECELTIDQKYDVVGGVINQKHLDVVFKSLRTAFDWK